MAIGIAPSRLTTNVVHVDPLRTLHQRFNRVFEEGFGMLAPWREENWALTAWTPACDTCETDKLIGIKIDLPDVKREDVEIALEDDLPTIRGQRKFENEKMREHSHRVERSYGEFLRSFSLPPAIDANQISAEFKDGVLHVILPKREKTRAKPIEIKTR